MMHRQTCRQNAHVHKDLKAKIVWSGPAYPSHTQKCPMLQETSENSMLPDHTQEAFLVLSHLPSLEAVVLSVCLSSSQGLITACLPTTL